MAIDFPNSPTVNDIFTVAEKSWIWDGSAWKVYFNPPVMYVQDTPPSVPKTGDQWYESDTGQHFVYYDSTWVETGSAITTNVNANDLSGTTLAANVVNSSLTSVGTLVSGSIPATLLTGIVDSARISGSYTGITGVGTLTGLTIGGAGANRSITINAPSGYYAIQYFAINGTNEWHYEVTPSGQSWSLVESGVAERIAVTSTGATFSGTVSPSATNTYDLGTAALRWRNIYTQDLHLSNGIGDYTVVEGEENLYLVNNKTNKSFKFALIEVDSSEVPKLSET